MATVVLGVTGCIGAYKACEVLRVLQQRGVEVHVAMTGNAARFVTPMTFEALSGHPVLSDAFAPAGGEIRHVSLADAADLLLVAPATANSLGKLAHGIADDALSTLLLATRAPVVVAPAMNVNMLRHPAVAENIETLRRRGVWVVEPDTGYLACGWQGEGRLADVGRIVDVVEARLTRSRDLAGQNVLVTAGPTVEDLDPVRFVSNRSTGRMGYRLAEAAHDRGARVVLVSGPTHLPDPSGIEVVRVRSAAEMGAVVHERAAQADTVVMAAAVSDYRPAEVLAHKLKKGGGPINLKLERTADVLAQLGREKRGRFLVGFAAETEQVVESAAHKLAAKNLDLVVANEVGREGTGFAAETNAAVLLDAGGGRVDVKLCSKRELAEKIWDRVGQLRKADVPVGTSA